MSISRFTLEQKKKRSHRKMGSAVFLPVSLPLPTNVTTIDSSSAADVRSRLVNHGFSLWWWKQFIFPYLGPGHFDRLRLRRFCRLFRDALPPPSLWTTFPHPKYSTLYKLVERISEVAKEYPSKAPKVVFISNGVHRVFETIPHSVRRTKTSIITQSAHTRESITVNCSLTFVGESREGAIVEGGFRVRGNFVRNKHNSDKFDLVKTCHVGFETMTVGNWKGPGLQADKGGSFDATNVSIDGCRGTGQTAGVLASSGGQCTLTDCSVTNCSLSGILSFGVVHLYGEKTKVTGNCAKGEQSSYYINGQGYTRHYGLRAWHSAKIILHAPLTKKSVSQNNHGWDWGVDGTKCVNPGTIEEKV
jgi:hypothetical protein